MLKKNLKTYVMGTPWKHVLKALQLASFGNPVG